MSQNASPTISPGLFHLIPNKLRKEATEDLTKLWLITPSGYLATHLNNLQELLRHFSYILSILASKKLRPVYSSADFFEVIV